MVDDRMKQRQKLAFKSKYVLCMSYTYGNIDNKIDLLTYKTKKRARTSRRDLTNLIN